MQLPAAYRYRVDALLRLIDAFDFEIDSDHAGDQQRLQQIPGFAAVQAIPGVGPILGAVFVAEIGDVHRFARPARLASWAGLTPKHRESDTTVRRGPITKQGSRLVRWAAVEAVQKGPRKHSRLAAARDRVADRRGGRNIATVAAARELIENVLYPLRDHHVRRLTRPAACGVSTEVSRSARVVIVMTPSAGVVALF